LLIDPIPFPTGNPTGRAPLDGEPRFDAGRHLALEKPTRIVRLAELGYDEATIAGLASPVVITGPFRVLSDEGVETFGAVLRALRSRCQIAEGRRLAVFLSGLGYLSRYVRDLCADPALRAFLSEIAGTPLIPHTVPQVQAFVNYAPDDPTKAVDTWHADSTGFAMVVMVSDPKPLVGGRFEWFHGTKAEAAACFGVTPDRLHMGFTDGLPEDRIESVAFPAAGWGVFQQGHMVVHRAAALGAPAERITFVPSYVARDPSFPDHTNTRSMRFYGRDGLLTELARHGAWLSRAKLEALVRERAATDDHRALAADLRAAVADALRIADELDGLDTDERDEP
jgi:hypothetical protein